MTAGTATTVKLRRSLTWWYRHLFVVVKRVVGLEEELSIFVLQILISYFFLTVKFRSSLSSSLFDVYDRYTAYCNSILRILTWLVRCTSVIVLLRKERLLFRASILCHIILEYFRHRVNLLKTILKLSFDVEIVCDNI